MTKSPSKPTITRDITVAYADDHVAVRKGIASYLNVLGGIKVVIEASNGKELLEKIEEASEPPDVCILDLKMPVMNGFDVVPILKKRWKKLKILVLSTYIEELYVVRMIRAGVDGYLSKSCDPEEIKTALVSITSAGKYQSDLFMTGMNIIVDSTIEDVPKLTAKEKICLNYCCTELSYSQIAKAMNCTLKSVEGYRDQLFKKFRVNSRISLVLYVLRTGIVQLDNGL